MKLPTYVFVDSKARKLLALLRHSTWRKALVQGVAATVEHRQLASSIQPETVIDIGANKGQFTLFAAVAWPLACVYAFEPLQSAARKFRKVTAGNRLISLFEVAVGPSAGMAEMHVSWREDSSSLLPMTSTLEAAFPGTAERTVQPVQLRRLHDVIDVAKLPRPILVKIDVQGYELAVLQGCDVALPHVDWLYVECSEIELYRGQALRKDIEAFLGRYGFRVRARHNVVTHERLGVLQSDILFARAA